MTDIDMSAEKRWLDPKWRILIAVMVGNFIVPLDASIVNTLLPSFTKFFHTKLSLVQWVPTVYLLTISCFILLYGRLGDMLGHKKIFITGLAGFTLASLLCGFSQNIWMLIAFRTIQGLAGGMVTAVGTAIVTAAFPQSQRGKALGIHLMCIAIGLTVGPTLGGIITHFINWRWVFFINVPIGIFALIWGIHVIPLGHIKRGQRLDMSGGVIAIVFLFSLLLYANRGEDWGWLSPLPI
ncbi:MAG: MFS transporter, partial [Deltaproteobacteria bacterium]|nr:MFS transporter [Deltaproteobacteria bacterium]